MWSGRAEDPRGPPLCARRSAAGWRRREGEGGKEGRSISRKMQRAVQCHAASTPAKAQQVCTAEQACGKQARQAFAASRRGKQARQAGTAGAHGKQGCVPPTDPAAHLHRQLALVMQQPKHHQGSHALLLAGRRHALHHPLRRVGGHGGHAQLHPGASWHAARVAAAAGTHRRLLGALVGAAGVRRERVQEEQVECVRAAGAGSRRVMMPAGRAGRRCGTRDGQKVPHEEARLLVRGRQHNAPAEGASKPATQAAPTTGQTPAGQTPAGQTHRRKFSKANTRA